MKHLVMRVEGPVSDPLAVRKVLFEALGEARATVLDGMSHEFSPQGYSVAVLLAESHATVHTWPEHGFATVDYFSCAEDPRIEEFEDVWFQKGYGIVNKEVLDR
jgi:S-adenosylmethionine decarboxylase proenzyme